MAGLLAIIVSIVGIECSLNWFNCDHNVVPIDQTDVIVILTVRSQSEFRQSRWRSSTTAIAFKSISTESGVTIEVRIASGTGPDTSRRPMVGHEDVLVRSGIQLESAVVLEGTSLEAGPH